MKRTFAFTTAAALCGLLAFSSGAFARGPGGGSGGGGGGGPGGGGEEDTAAQNLSVPTIMVGEAVGGLLCGTAEVPTPLVPPTGDPLTGYEVSGYYYVQKVHSWQAQCFSDSAAVVFGAWGDNLGGDAKLKVGSPIRVEIVLENLTEYPALGTLQGYTVIKLQPTLLDRLSAYGHVAGVDELGGFYDIPTDFPQTGWLVHDAGITFSVLNTDTNVYAVPPGTSPTAEINATGKVVYGYNLRVSTAGPYRIQFTSSTPVVFNGVDVGGQLDEHNVYIDINVTAGGGGGGRK